jgi:hypothetical protein
VVAAGDDRLALRELRAGDGIVLRLADLSSRALKHCFSLAAEQLG